jgi:hypothetical protein
VAGTSGSQPRDTGFDSRSKHPSIEKGAHTLTQKITLNSLNPPCLFFPNGLKEVKEFRDQTMKEETFLTEYTPGCISIAQSRISGRA